MRKAFSWISVLFVIPLVACSLNAGNPPVGPGPAITPTISGDQMQTEISRLLTMMPTGTGQPAVEVTPVPDLPTVAVQTETPAPAVETQPPAAETQPPATETQSPAAIVTETPQPDTGYVATATLISTSAAATGSAATATKAPVAAATATTAPGGAPANIPAGDPRNSLGAPTSTDLMDDPFAWNWPTGSDQFSQASFRNGRLSVQSLTTKDSWRMANPKGQDFTDLYLEATFNVGDTCQKDAPGMADHYGMIVRVPNLRQPWQGYLLAFNCNGQYSLRSWNWDGKDERRQEMRMLIDWTTPAATGNQVPINVGARTTNRMGLMVIGSRLTLYANGIYLAEYDYNTNNNIPHLSSGYFGVFVGSRNDTKFTIWVDEMSYWDRPNTRP